MCQRLMYYLADDAACSSGGGQTSRVTSGATIVSGAHCDRDHECLRLDRDMAAGSYYESGYWISYRKISKESV